jgi:hypothetical protein
MKLCHEDGDLIMPLLFKKLAFAAVSAAMLTGVIAPAEAAMPLPAAPAVAATSDVTNVQYYRHWRGGPGYYGPRPGYYGRPGYYSGYRGYRYHRPGYRFHEGYWYPLAAFGAGAIIGGAVAAPRYVEPAPAPVYRATNVSARHQQWCATRYRSYDPYSNTFQPYNGPRRTCVSPYY